MDAKSSKLEQSKIGETIPGYSAVLAPVPCSVSFYFISISVHHPSHEQDSRSCGSHPLPVDIQRRSVIYHIALGEWSGVEWSLSYHGSLSFLPPSLPSFFPLSVPSVLESRSPLPVSRKGSIICFTHLSAMQYSAAQYGKVNVGRSDIK